MASCNMKEASHKGPLGVFCPEGANPWRQKVDLWLPGAGGEGT